MTRKTLTLPPKTDAEKAEALASPRKPIRGGSKLSRAPKPPRRDNDAGRGKPAPGRKPAAPGARADTRPPQQAGAETWAKPAREATRERPSGTKPPAAGARTTPREAPAADRRAGSDGPRPGRDTERHTPPRTNAAPPRAAGDRPAPAKPYWPGVSKGPAPDAKQAAAPAPRRDPKPAAPAAAQPAPARSPRRAPSEPPRRALEPATPAAAPAVPARPPRGDHSEPPRLSKRMGELGLCSRREADEWIENGWVRVDGVVIDTLGSRVSPHAKIEVDPAARLHQSESVTILINKPVGYVSGQAEDGHEPASVLLRPENRWAEDNTPTRFKLGHLRGLAPAGRLDIDSTGLLVFTQDGRVAKRLVGENSAVEKEYLVRVEGSLSEDGMKLLRHGLELDGVKLKPAEVSWQNEDQLRFVLHEGRKRQIRRMCELVGLNVTGLKRVRIGSVVLGKLPVGEWRYLRFDEKF